MQILLDVPEFVGFRFDDGVTLLEKTRADAIFSYWSDMCDVSAERVVAGAK